MSETVSDYVARHPCKGFKPVPTYSETGDLLKLYWDDETAYAEPINEYVTLIRAFSDKRVVGVKIGGIQTLVRDGKVT